MAIERSNGELPKLRKEVLPPQKPNNGIGVMLVAATAMFFAVASSAFILRARMAREGCPALQQRGATTIHVHAPPPAAAEPVVIPADNLVYVDDDDDDGVNMPPTRLVPDAIYGADEQHDDDDEGKAKATVKPKAAK